MKNLIYIILVIALMGAPPIIGHRDTERAEILIVDLSKKLLTNPYQEEYEKLLYPTVKIKTPTSTGSGVVIGDYIITAAHVVGDESVVEIEIFSLMTDGLSVSVPQWF